MFMMRVYTMPLYCTCSVSQRCKNYFPAFFAVQILPSHIFMMRVYTMPLYCTCSVSQRCKKTRATSLRRPFCSRNIRPKFKTETPIILNFGRIFRLQNGRRREVALVFLQLSVSALQKLFSGFFCRSNPSQPHIYDACVHNAFVLYLRWDTEQVQYKGIVYTRIINMWLGGIWTAKIKPGNNYVKLYNSASFWDTITKVSSTHSLRRPLLMGVSERGRRKLYFDLTFVIVSQKLAELYSLT